MIHKLVIRTLLAALNSRWLNNSPCRYGFIGNVDAFDYSHLASEEAQRPGITVKTILEEAERFKSCRVNHNGLTVLEADGTHHGATVWDLRDLREAFSRETPDLREVDRMTLCSDCPPAGHPTDKTRCDVCPRRSGCRCITGLCGLHPGLTTCPLREIGEKATTTPVDKRVRRGLI